jgi:hypothetical protein
MHKDQNNSNDLAILRGRSCVKVLAKERGYAYATCGNGFGGTAHSEGALTLDGAHDLERPIASARERQIAFSIARMR